MRRFVGRLKQASVDNAVITDADGDDPMTYHQLCDYFVDTYERAKFSRHEFTYTDYKLFMWRVFRLIYCLHPQAMGDLAAEVAETQSLGATSLRDSQRDTNALSAAAASSSPRTRVRFQT